MWLVCVCLYVCWRFDSSKWIGRWEISKWNENVEKIGFLLFRLCGFILMNDTNSVESRKREKEKEGKKGKIRHFHHNCW